MSITNLIKRLPPFVFTITVVLAVLYLTLMPDPLPDNDISLFPGADKVVHAIMMLGVIGCLALDYLRKHPGRTKAPGALLIIFCIATTAFGGAIGLVQGSMDMGRGEDIYDFYADTAGALLGLFIAYALWTKVNRWIFGDRQS